MTLVLLPGMDGTGRLFAPFLESLGTEVSSVVVRYPSDGPQSYERLAQIAEAALARHGPIVLLGESFSGPIAVSLAAKHPDKVAGVVLCCTFLQNPRPSMKWAMALAGWLPALVPPTPVVSALLFGRFKTPELVDQLRSAIASIPAAILRDRLKAVTTVDVRVEASSLSIPVLYLRATEDRLVPENASASVRSICSQVSVKKIQGPHCLLQAAPLASAKAVVAFALQTLQS